MNLWTQRIRESTSSLQSQLHTAMSFFVSFIIGVTWQKMEIGMNLPNHSLWCVNSYWWDVGSLLSVVLVVIMKMHFCWSTTHFYQHNLRTLRVYWLFVFILAWSNWTTFYLPTPTPFNSWVYYYLPPIKEAKLLYNFCQWTRTTTTIPG